MKRRAIVGTCLVVSCGVIGVLASSASALQPPVWAVCVKVPKVNKSYHGHYDDKNCAEMPEGGDNGKYELEAGVGKAKAFKGKVGPTRLDVQTPFGDNAVTCSSGKSEGKPATPNRMQGLTITFKRCELTLLSSKTEDPCFSTGLKEGEIKITGMGGELGYIEEFVEESPYPRIGLRLEHEAEPGGVIVEFKCNYKVTAEHPKHEAVVESGQVTQQVIGEVKGPLIAEVSKESELVFEGKEQYGEQEFDGEKYKPIVNFVGWVDEVEGIDEAAAKNEEETDPAHVLKGEFCGPFVEGALHEDCTPPAYAGLTSTTKNKGEALWIKWTTTIL